MPFEKKRLHLRKKDEFLQQTMKGREGRTKIQTRIISTGPKEGNNSPTEKDPHDKKKRGG